VRSQLHVCPIDSNHTRLRFVHHLNEEAKSEEVGPGWEYDLDRMLGRRWTRESQFSSTFSMISLNTFCRPVGGGTVGVGRKLRAICNPLSGRNGLATPEKAPGIRRFMPVVERPRVNSSKSTVYERQHQV
jgi:hypothetical protein